VENAAFRDFICIFTCGMNFSFSFYFSQIGKFQEMQSTIYHQANLFISACDIVVLWFDFLFFQIILF